jgi:hypothetical protein
MPKHERDGDDQEQRDARDLDHLRGHEDPGGFDVLRIALHEVSGVGLIVVCGRQSLKVLIQTMSQSLTIPALASAAQRARR